MRTSAHAQQAADAADLCQLLAAAFRFPERDLADGLLDGGYLQDVGDCLAGLGLADPTQGLLDLWLKPYQTLGGDPGPDLRREYTRLFLAPGRELIFPFESRFRAKSGAKEPSSAFLNNTTLHVEQTYRQAGLVSAKANREPLDHVATELEFMMYLHLRQCEAIAAGNPEDAEKCAQQAADFQEQHLARWLPDFMREVQELSQCPAYCAFAEVGLALTGFLAAKARPN